LLVGVCIPSDTNVVKNGERILKYTDLQVEWQDMSC
jgi:hypothetical protein